MADVFLSYARGDAAAAERVARALERAGQSVWFDRELPAHRPYADVIATELESASAVLVLWSKAAAASQWVRSEADRARELGKLVQARLDRTRLPMPFDQIQCADLSTWRAGRKSEGWSQVSAAIDSLSGAQPKAIVPEPAPASTRRGLLIGGSALAAVGLGGGASVLWPRGGDRGVSPEAQLLIQKGLDALQNNDALDTQDPGSTLQAIALLSDATEAAPRSATAWGGLALAYAVRKRSAPIGERAGLDARSRSAAQRGLTLDAREPRSLGALRLLDRVYRNWIEVERADRKALSKNPKLPILLFIMSDMLGNVGRWRDAMAYSQQFDRKKFLIPGADRKVVIDAWSAGDLQAADTAIDLAIQHWPQHPQIWRTRLAYLMFSGRPDEALELLARRTDRPTEFGADYVAVLTQAAEALAGMRAASEAMATALDYARQQPSFGLQTAQIAAALGDHDTAFTLLNGYYFGEGPWKSLAPQGGDDDRTTNRLFQPPTKSIWRDARFASLVERIGLSGYWQASGTVPDYRRVS